MPQRIIGQGVCGSVLHVVEQRVDWFWAKLETGSLSHVWLEEGDSIDCISVGAAPAFNSRLGCNKPANKNKVQKMNAERERERDGGG